MTGGGNDFYKRKSMETAYAGFIIKSGDSAMQKNNSVKIRLAEERDFEALHRHDKANLRGGFGTIFFGTKYPL